MKIVLAIALVSITNLYAQDDSISMLFPGLWKMEIENAEIYEEWQLVNKNELIGTSYSLENGIKIINKNLWIKKFADQWAYIAMPGNQNITLFALIEHSPKKLLFENKEHDFPQRISYEFHKGGKMTAVVEGNVGLEIKRKEFSFHLVED
ncbi:MAG: DUF6265 family protein [Ignavibacteriaceae bacterium]|nr:DUF6265 family protein [Ignavibacteriaceae bacterium]